MVVIMKSTTKPRERKTPHGAANQLSTRIAKPDVKAVSKARRVFSKAGIPDPSDGEVKQYLSELAKTELKSSRGLAKSIRNGGK